MGYSERGEPPPCYPGGGPPSPPGYLMVAVLMMACLKMVDMDHIEVLLMVAHLVMVIPFDSGNGDWDLLIEIDRGPMDPYNLLDCKDHRHLKDARDCRTSRPSRSERTSWRNRSKLLKCKHVGYKQIKAVDYPN